MQQAMSLQELTVRSEALTASLSGSEWVGSELSKGMAVAMRALETNQVGGSNPVDHTLPLGWRGCNSHSLGRCPSQGHGCFVDPASMVMACWRKSFTDIDWPVVDDGMVQAARAVLQRKLVTSRQEAYTLSKQLEQANRQVRIASTFISLTELSCWPSDL
jgi:hypothetical protein